MEQIESQASDLRYLTQAPVPLPGDRQHAQQARGGGGGIGFSPHNQTAHSAHSHVVQSPTLSATAGDNSAHPTGVSQDIDGAHAGKRKSDDDGLTGKQQRSKRNRVSFPSCPCPSIARERDVRLTPGLFVVCSTSPLPGKIPMPPSLVRSSTWSCCLSVWLVTVH